MGFQVVWTDEKLIEEVKLYKTRQEFRKGAPSAYVTARKKGNNYCDILFKEMKPSNRNKWNIQNLCALSSTFEDRKSFRKKYPSAHSSGQKLGILDLMYAHMKRGGGFDILSPAIMYYVKINNGEAYKIGITNTTVQLRFKPKDFKKMEVIRTWEFSTGKEAIQKELEIKKDFVENKWTGRDLLINGNTELFNSDILLLDNLSV